jgi:hypothetical protein
MPRGSFTGDGGTDSAATWWFIWSPDIAGIHCIDETFAEGQLALFGSEE